jgi:hypothetical protein
MDIGQMLLNGDVIYVTQLVKLVLTQKDVLAVS